MDIIFVLPPLILILIAIAEHLGTPVKVMFRWDKSDPEHPVWEQVFSVDNERTWETNWIMHFRRP